MANNQFLRILPHSYKAIVLNDSLLFTYHPPKLTRLSSVKLGLALILFTVAIFSPAQAEPTQINIQSTITAPIWSPSLPKGGIGGAVLQLLSTAANVQYHLEYLPVTRFQQSTAPYRVGDPDILATQKLYTVLPLMVFHSAFFFYLPHHQLITVHQLKDLSGHTLGVLRGTVEDKNYFINQGIKVEENDSTESLLKKLKKGRIDFCILVELAGKHSVKQLFPNEQHNFVSILIPKSERPIALILDQDSPAAKNLAARYQKILHKTLHSRDYYAILETYYGKNNVPTHWFEQMNKFTRIYAPETN